MYWLALSLALLLGDPDGFAASLSEMIGAEPATGVAALEGGTDIPPVVQIAEGGTDIPPVVKIAEGGTDIPPVVN